MSDSFHFECNRQMEGEEGIDEIALDSVLLMGGAPRCVGVATVSEHAAICAPRFAQGSAQDHRWCRPCIGLRLLDTPGAAQSSSGEEAWHRRDDVGCAVDGGHVDAAPWPAKWLDGGAALASVVEQEANGPPHALCGD